MIRQVSHALGEQVRVRIDFSGGGEPLPAGVPPAAPETVQSLSSGKCLDVAKGSKADGAPVIQYDCHEGPNQKWRVQEAAEDSYRIVNANSGQCLQAHGGATAAGTPVVQAPCDGRPGQLWALSPSDASYQLKESAGGLCLDVPHASRENGVQPALWDCHGGVNQEWKIDAMSAPAAE